MCGIFLLVKSYYKHISIDLRQATTLYSKLSKRGPDQSNLTLYGNDIIGFHRLSINDLSEKGLQPFSDNIGNYLMCNGEIYNHKELESRHNITPTSRSDCECLLSLIRDRGIDSISGGTLPLVETCGSSSSLRLSDLGGGAPSTLSPPLGARPKGVLGEAIPGGTKSLRLSEAISEIDGVFAIVAKIGCKYYFIRDRIGVKPLFMYKCDDFIAAASDPSALEFGNPGGSIIEVEPGTVVECDFSFNIAVTRYYTVPTNPQESLETTQDEIISTTRKLLCNAVEKRLMSDRPLGCLLSGGLDSSIISAVVAKIYRDRGQKLNTFSVGFSDSTDLKYARKVAEHIGSNHHELIITPKGALSTIPSIVRNIGTWDITTIRASTPMWLLCQWISHNFTEKVLFSGEGADEVFGGYLYFHSAPTPEDFTTECGRLVSELYKYDVLRADRCISGNSLDLREPFLDKDLIDYYLRLPSKYRIPVDGYEKWILRKAFDDMLPREVCWRRKTAFSDGISSSEKPWYKYIQEWTDSMFDENDLGEFKTTESKWYHMLFKSNYKVYNPRVSYWLPKWQGNNVLDPSATTLKIWNKQEH